MDKLSVQKRSWNMSRIKGSDTRPERYVRSFLFKEGLRFRKNVANLPGKPDIVFPKSKIVVFVNGCFWHAHRNCTKFRYPTSNTQYWIAKLNENVRRDSMNYERLHEMGYRVVVIWECELKNISCLNNLLSKLK